VLFYTDGLIENPKAHGAAHRWGVDGLVAWLSIQPPEVTAPALDALIDAATAGREVRDDIAVLVVAAADAAATADPAPDPAPAA
jgi:hypothetical protein